MWRNLKISMKLLLGFGLVLSVFLVSVFVMWRYVRFVEVNSRYLGEEVLMSSELAIAFEIEASQVFFAARTIQLTESPEAIAAFREQLAKAEAVKGKIIDLNREYPELRAPAHVVDVVVPLTIQYVTAVENTITLIERRKVQLRTFGEKGAETSEIALRMFDRLHSHMRNSIQGMVTRSDPTEAHSLSDAVKSAALFLERAMSVRRDVWQAVSLVRTGAGLDEMRAIVGRIKELQDHADELRPYFSNTQDDVRMLEELANDLREYEATLAEFIEVCTELDNLNQARGPMMDNLYRESNFAAEYAFGRAKEISQDNIEDLNWAITLMLISAIVSLILGLLIAVFIARSISKPLNTIVSLAKRAGEGDLTVKKADFGYEGRDELGGMIMALADMIASQSSTMKHVADVSKNLTEGAGDLSAISEETSAAMQEIRSSVNQVSMLSESNGSALEECNAGVEEMSAGADSVANSATDSAAFISQTTDASNKAIQTVHNVIGGMRNVDDNARKSEEKMRQLVSSVENVSSFVSVITGIADQTNLLALNAAIEAARAGEVGRGFAVVAEEVRKLAEESAHAAQNVNAIIQELQTGAQESIRVTTEAGRLLSSTLVNAENALKELNDAIDQINKTNDSIQNIAAVAEEQAASSKEVATAIDSATKASLELAGTVGSIQRATDETSQATEGVAKQAESMMGYARILTELLSQFKVEAESQPTNTLALKR